ncbi:methyltransferase [Xanthomonas hyacinthi]|uniref:SAM-dependent methyltransferase n=1 Tax=Xanthomonas hyacinthi TaxID=56455 RepID=A0A2S7ENY3_9XANT|nr:methyltransferase domain-containing protein [Xanthomonas hyacinthi]KLD78350.1 methyltransferase [Xanthomonas hyacinthi DSM 19077]PPU93698.1 SAM-dependent methyltransferase [Xanthomonas hyacinthi]QGY77437.1 methyltransferase [Xanthomonas hyacinthi]
MTRPQALAIARAFLPTHPLGNRYDYYYTRTKLRTDPLYPGVLAALRGTEAPVLDLGCGLGLLAHALRADGQQQRYRGVDIDAAKIRRAIHIAARNDLHGTRFDVVDLRQSWPEHRGSVALLDVLQYLDDGMQASLIRSVAKMLSPGAKLVIRSSLGEASGRGRTSRIADVLAHLAGWMQEVPKCYPTRDSLQAQLDTAGLRASFAPLYGNTPFNNWLIVAAPN